MHFIKVGLTGGIAAGKSTVADLWRKRGALVIDADELGHRALVPGTPTYAEIVKHFGREILKADQTISRSALAEIVFADEPQREALNRIVHPAVRQMWKELLATAQTEVAVVSIPLLFEVQAEAEFDRVVTVACSLPTQLARLGAKGLTAPQARARIHAQWPMADKMDQADFVIWNDGTPAVLQGQADMIWNRMKENSHAATKN